MTEYIATVGGKIVLDGADQAVKGLSDVASSGAKAEASLKQVEGASKTTSDATAALAASAKKASQAHSEMAGAAGLNRAQMMELAHVARSVTDSLAAGVSPMRAFGMESARIAQIMGSGSGGVTGTLRAVASGLLPLAGAAGLFALMVGPVIAVGAALLQGANDARQFASAIRLTGDYAGVTIDQFEGMAVSLGKLDGIGKAREALTTLVASGKVTGTELQSLGEVVVRLSVLTGESATKIASQWAGMGSDVAAFAEKVNSQYHLITEAQFEHIKLLQDEGQVAQAQYALIKDAQSSLAQRGEADLGVLERAWRGVAGAISQVWESLKKLGAGGDQGIQNSIDALQAVLKSGVAPGSGSFGAPVRSLSDSERAGFQAELTNLQNVLKAHQQAAQAAAGQQQAEQAGIEAAKEHASVYSTMGDNLARVNAEIAKYRANQAAIRKVNPSSAELDSPARAAKIEADIRKRYTESLRTHARQAPSDQTDSLDASVAQQVAQADQQVAAARRAQLQAALGLATSEEKRLDIQKKIDAQAYAQQIAGYDSKISEIDKQIAQIERPGVLDAHKKQHVAALEGAQAEIENAKKAAEQTEAYKNQLADNIAFDRNLKHQVAMQTEALSTQESLLQIQAQSTQSAYARAAIELQIQKVGQQRLQLAQQEILDSKNSTDAQKAEAVQRLADLKTLAAAENALKAKELDLAHAMGETEDSIRSVGEAFKNGDFVGAVSSLQRAMDTMAKALGDASGTGILSQLSRFLGSTGSEIAAVAQLGTDIASGLSHAFGLNSKQTSLAKTSGAFVGGPIGTIIGALFGGKPSNGAAITTLTSDSFSVNHNSKETGDAVNAVTAASQAILAGEAALRAAGITPNKTVTGLDLGSRDPTHIYLSNGQQIRSAVGDPTAAAEAALKAVLEGATFVDDTQKKLVQSMEAAGKGFDDINAALQGYAAAQKISGSIADQILQLTDPKAFDLKGVSDAIQAQRDAAQQAATAGYLTADQLSAVNAQLDQLKGLQLNQVVTKYAAANDNVNSAQSALQAAYDAQKSALEDTVTQYTQVAQSLREFADSLSGATSPLQTRASTLAAFQSLTSKTDADSLGKLPGAGQAYLDAVKATAHSQLDVVRAQSQVRNAVEAAAKVADSQVSVAEQQLKALDDSVKLLLDIKTGVLSVVDAIRNLDLARAGAGDAAAGAKVTAQAQTYLAANPDVAASAASGWLSTVNVPDLNADGKVDALDRAIWHFQNFGQNEGRGFATGGSITPSGPSSGDRIPVSWMMNGGETAFISRQDSMQAVLAELRSLRAEVAGQRVANDKTARSTTDHYNLTKAMTDNGQSLNVKTAA